MRWASRDVREDKILISDSQDDHDDRPGGAGLHPPAVRGTPGAHQARPGQTEEGGGAGPQEGEEVPAAAAQHHRPGRHQVQVSLVTLFTTVISEQSGYFVFYFILGWISVISNCN